MVKAKKRVGTRKKSSKRGKASAKPVRKKAAKRAKKAKSKVRHAAKGVVKSAAKKKRPRKAAARPAPRQVRPVVEDTIIDVIDEPVPGVVRVTEYETIRTIPPQRSAGPGTEDNNN
jgi:hypothetical protein